MIRRIKVFSEMIKFEHTIFALPYAYIGMILASYATAGEFPSLSVILWVTLAMVGARSSAMALNRLIDKYIDAQNPRTANRELPRGIISTLEVVLFIMGSFVLLGVSAWMLNPLCFRLLPVALFFLVIYPYTKRFTWCCHLVLGITDALAPIGGWIAVTGHFDSAALVLGGAVAAWITGFDIIYACQDVEVDRRIGVYSIPARFGISKALWISKFLHIVTVILFLVLPLFVHLGWIYYIGTIAVAALLVVEHRLISPSDMSRIHTAFFTINSYIASVAFIFTLLDVLLR